ncbi:hypothetical protein FRC17_007756, partial [Serendipita sp. 399]
MAMSSNKTALILVDIQHDFLPPDGSLAVTEGDQILPPVYRLIENAEKYFDLIVASLVRVYSGLGTAANHANHPVSHVSFASTHGKEPFTTLEIPKLNSNETITQMLWPDHCVQGTKGCELESGIKKRLEEVSHMVQYVRKASTSST